MPTNPTPTVDLNFDRPRRRVGFANAFASAVMAVSVAFDAVGGFSVPPSRPPSPPRY
jgi:hypothetical protein